MIHVHSPTIMIIMETKVCGDRAKGIVDRIHMDGAIIANSIGLSGGMWLLWDSNQVEVVELSLTEQEIHVSVSSTSKPHWLLSAVYGSPKFAERCLIWENLNAVADAHSMPWVIAERIQSDHCLVKLCMDNNQNSQFPRPFKFQPMWLSHPSFPGVVSDAWSRQNSLKQAQSNFTVKANAWNKTEFGNLFHRKRRLVARLKGIQENLSIQPNNFLVDLERKLRIDYAEVIKLEEEFWAMKARILWLVEGD
ncbi:uncharacterized protein LOC142624437 [Castanea sativa]|uniref:uncharacterized protein LOC142624437 n=1 Tax=Castanea sativa TaxID=21020 RepID=UPI003F6500E3